MNDKLKVPKYFVHTIVSYVIIFNELNNKA